MDNKKIITILIILITINIIGIVGIQTYIHMNDNTTVQDSSVVEDNIITDESEEEQDEKDVNCNILDLLVQPVYAESKELMFLSTSNPEDNIPFKMPNMLPGDSETKQYVVQVTYRDDVVLKYHASIQEGYEKMAEVLKIKINIDGSEVYDGLMRDMPESIDMLLETDTTTKTKVTYEITSYLETSVGNEYQNKQLYADFEWWIEGDTPLEDDETDEQDKPGEDDNQTDKDKPSTNDMNSYMPFVSLMLVSLVMFISLKKRKGNN